MRAILPTSFLFLFFFNDTATTEIYTLSLHDALPISIWPIASSPAAPARATPPRAMARSEEHTSELQSRSDLVCRLLLEKKKKIHGGHIATYQEEITHKVVLHEIEA